MNKVILNQNKYTGLPLSNTLFSNKIQYNLVTNTIKLKQKNYINIILKFVTIFNTFVTEKYPDNKELWLIINDNQTTNYSNIDEKYKSVEDKILELEKLIEGLEAKINKAGSPQKLIYSFSGYSSLGRFEFLPGKDNRKLAKYPSVMATNSNYYIYGGSGYNGIHLDQTVPCLCLNNFSNKIAAIDIVTPFLKFTSSKIDAFSITINFNTNAPYIWKGGYYYWYYTHSGTFGDYYSNATTPIYGNFTSSFKFTLT